MKQILVISLIAIAAVWVVFKFMPGIFGFSPAAPAAQ
jgi:hypothetical protein